MFNCYTISIYCYATISIVHPITFLKIIYTPTHLERRYSYLKTTTSTNEMIALQPDKLSSMGYITCALYSPYIYTILNLLNRNELPGVFFAYEFIILMCLVILSVKLKQYLTQKRISVFLADLLLFLSIIYQLFLYIVQDWEFLKLPILNRLWEFDFYTLPTIMIFVLIAQICLFISSIFLPKRYQNIKQKKSEKVIRVILELVIIAITIGFLQVLTLVGKGNFGAVTAVEVALLSIRPTQFLALNFGEKYLDKEVTLNVRQKFLQAKFFLTLFYVSWAIDAYSELSIKKLVTPKNKILYDAMGFNIAGNFFDKFYSIAIPFLILCFFSQIFIGIVRFSEKEFSNWIIPEDYPRAR